MKVQVHSPVYYRSISAKAPSKKSNDDDLPTSMDDLQALEDGNVDEDEDEATDTEQEEPSDSDKKISSIKQSVKPADADKKKPTPQPANVKQIALYKQRESESDQPKQAGRRSSGPQVRINPIPSVDVRLSDKSKATVVMVIYNPSYPIGKNNGLFMDKDDFPIFKKAISKVTSYMKSKKRATKVDVRLMGAVYTITYNSFGMLLVFKDRDKLVMSLSSKELKVFMSRFS